jgi:hypothetical protein
MADMASVSIDQGVIILGKTGNYIIIIYSIIGGWEHEGGWEGKYRSEILSYKGGNWSEIGQLGIARYYSAATPIKVDPTICD